VRDGEDWEARYKKQINIRQDAKPDSRERSKGKKDQFYKGGSRK